MLRCSCKYCRRSTFNALRRRNPDDLDKECYRCNKSIVITKTCDECSGETGAVYCDDCVSKCNYCNGTFCFEGDFVKTVHGLSGFEEQHFDPDSWGCLSPWLHNCKSFRRSYLRRRNPDDLEELEKMVEVRERYKETGDITKIAKQLHINFYLVRSWVSDLIKSKEDSRIARARKIYLKTGSIRKTAKRVKAGLTTVKMWVADLIPNEIDWKKAVDSLIAKGYSPTELAQIICQRIDCSLLTAHYWFTKSHPPRVVAHHAIIKLDQELQPKQPKPQLNWKDAVDSLIAKGFNQTELARILCQRIDCKLTMAKQWFGKRKTSPLRLDVQQAIIKLDQELEPKFWVGLNLDWQGAVDNLLAKGYLKNELGQILCQRIDCNPGTAQHWFAKRRTPPSAIQQVIIVLDQELEPKLQLGWKEAVDSLIAKGFSQIELARILEQRINCRLGAAKEWFGKRRIPSLDVQQIIVKLDQELHKKVKHLKSHKRKRYSSEDREKARKRYSSEDREKARLLYENNMRIIEISHQTGINKITLSMWKKKYGWKRKQQFLKKREVTEVQQARDLYIIHKSILKVAKLLDHPRSTSTIRSWIGDLIQKKKRGDLPQYSPENASEEEIKRLKKRVKARQLYLDGKSPESISKILGVSRRTIMEWVRDLFEEKLKQKQLREEVQKKLARELYTESISLDKKPYKRSARSIIAIARIVGAPERYVRQWIDDLYITADEMYLKAYNHGLGDQEMADAIGVTVGTIYHWRYKNDLDAN